MKLDVDFSALLLAVERMGAADLDTGFRIDLPYEPPDQIDIQLGDGLELKLEDVDANVGLLSYRGRQILLYIQDHGGNVKSALRDGSVGKKFHIADCRTLREMREKSRFERYVATNDLSGDFFITGYDYHARQALDGKTQLKVCKNCLDHLNYQNYRYANQGQIFSRFSLAEFFSAFSSFFPYKPRRMAGEKDGIYSPDWIEVSSRYRQAKGFRCESCGVDLTSKKNLLHTHHKNGVKTDNRPENLMALCIDCHRKQSGHDHLFVTHEETRIINQLRRQQQGEATSGWNQVFEYVDPAMMAVAQHCQQRGFSAPEVGYELKDAGQAVVAHLELAWPSRRLGVAIAKDDLQAARKLGWQVLTMIETLEMR